MHNSVIVRPYFGIYQISFVTPGSLEKPWTTEDTLEKVYDTCRKFKKKILFVSNCSLGLNTQILSEPSDIDLIWEPNLSRKEAKKIHSTQEAFCKWLSREKSPAIPKNLDELSEYGVLFGGQLFLAPRIRQKLEQGAALEFENNNFKLVIPEELATQYIA